MSSANAVLEVGHVDCAGGGQIVVEKGVARVGPVALLRWLIWREAADQSVSTDPNQVCLI